MVGVHDSHRGDLVGFFRGGGNTLFPEERELLGDLEGKKLWHADVGDGLGIPLVIQDHPASSAVRMPAEFIAELLSFLPGAAVKLEDPPTPPKMARLRALAPAALAP